MDYENVHSYSSELLSKYLLYVGNVTGLHESAAVYLCITFQVNCNQLTFVVNLCSQPLASTFGRQIYILPGGTDNPIAVDLQSKWHCGIFAATSPCSKSCLAHDRQLLPGTDIPGLKRKISPGTFHASQYNPPEFLPDTRSMIVLDDHEHQQKKYVECWSRRVKSIPNILGLHIVSTPSKHTWQEVPAVA